MFGLVEDYPSSDDETQKIKDTKKRPHSTDQIEHIHDQQPNKKTKINLNGVGKELLDEDLTLPEEFFESGSGVVKGMEGDGVVLPSYVGVKMGAPAVAAGKEVSAGKKDRTTKKKWCLHSCDQQDPTW